MKFNKAILLPLLCIGFVTGCSSPSGGGGEDTRPDLELTYQLFDDGSAYILKNVQRTSAFNEKHFNSAGEWDGYKATLNIPETYEGLPVKQLGRASSILMYNCGAYVGTINMPNTIETIAQAGPSTNQGTFYNCTGLESVTLSTSLTSIPQTTFYGCTSLNNVVVPASVRRIEGGAFSGCTSLTNLEWHPTDDNPVIKPNAFNQTKVSFDNVSHADSTKKIALEGKALQGLNIERFTLTQDKYTYSGSESIIFDSAKFTEFTYDFEDFAKVSWVFCNDLTKITLTRRVNHIAQYALANVTLNNTYGSKTDKSIWYEGTKAEWNEIVKEDGYNEDSWNHTKAILTVHCSDGDKSL